MSSFFHGLADKAQNALNSSPIAAHIPHRPTSTQQPQDGAQPPPQVQPQTQPGRSHALESMSHQLRVLQQQYGSSATTLQKLITAEKSVVIDYDSLARDIKIQSKELFTYGQAEADDLKDVTDRAAYLNFVHGSLADALAVKLDNSRIGLKSVRDAEAALIPKRNVRAGLQQQIAKIKSDGQKGSAVDRRLAELEDSLKKADAEDIDLERQLEISKRKFIRESEAAKWVAVREYAEKLLLLSQAGASVLEVLPSIPPTPATPYTGAGKTASVRDALQRSLDNWTPGSMKLPPLPERSNTAETRSFGETHATELSNIASHPPSQLQSSALPSFTAGPPSAESKPIDPTELNQTPVTIPSPPSATSASAVPLASATPDLALPAPVIPSATPTIAEAGVPIAAGAGGPGPKTGSLLDRSPAAAAVKHESAEDEKKRLEREERERVLRLAASPPGYDPSAPTAAAPANESAEQEKKRLEREERERVLAAGGSKPGPSNEGGDVPPPY